MVIQQYFGNKKESNFEILLSKYITEICKKSLIKATSHKDDIKNNRLRVMSRINLNFSDLFGTGFIKYLLFFDISN